MNTLAWRQLVLGDFRKWKSPSPILMKQYHQWVGRYTHVGIELEFNFNIMSVYETLERQYRALADNEDRYQILSSHEYEIQVLWNVTDPIRFVTRMRQFCQALYMTGLNGIGSVHVNIQKTHKTLPPGVKEYYSHQVRFNIDRIESKMGPSFLSANEFIAKMLVAIVSFPDEWKRGATLAKGLENTLPILKLGGTRDYLEARKRYHKGIIKNNRR